MNCTAMLCAAIFGTTTAIVACNNDSNDGDDGALDPNLARDQILGCIPVSAGFYSGESLSCDGNTLVACEALDTLNPLVVNIAFACDHVGCGGGVCDPDGSQPGEAACVHETLGGLCLPGLVECGGTLTCNTQTLQCE